MASSQPSAKEFIETNVRMLPVARCLVNKNWRQTSEASVVVMRRQDNGNVTAGIYLVDLLCLGVMDSFFYHNIPEEEVLHKLPANGAEDYEPAEYSLVHNIVYAAHHFAEQFGIEAHPSFATTRFILEPENNNIPVLHIAVGDEQGLPHLYVNEPGEYSAVLAKLQQHAGAGKFRYTINNLWGNSLTNEETADGSAMADYQAGDISAVAARFISDEELGNAEKVKARSGAEKRILQLEQLLRQLRKAKPALFGADIEESDEYELIDNIRSIACGVTKEEENTFRNAYEQRLRIESEKDEPGNSSLLFRELLTKEAENVLLVSAVFESECSTGGKLFAEAKEKLQSLQRYPLARLDLALANLLQPLPEAGFEAVYNLESCKPLCSREHPGEKDLAAFWLMKTKLHLNKGDLSAAIRFYYLYSDVNTTHFLATAIQNELITAIGAALQQ